MNCWEKPTRLHLVRHGEVNESYHEVFGGQIDMELSPNGHKQAKCLAKFLDGRNFNRIYCSPMLRVQQTAKPLLDVLGREAQMIDDLREIDFGAWTGCKWHEIRDKFGADAEDWLLHLENDDVPQAEPMDSYRSRVQCILKQMIEEGLGEDLLVLCHGGVIRMLLSLLLDEPFAKMGRFEVDYASLTLIEYRTNRVEIKLHNFAPWLWLRNNG